MEETVKQKTVQEEVQNEIIQHKKVRERLHITKSNKETIAVEQKWKCNNSPNGPVCDENSNTGCADYECPMWKLYDGSFDESKYEVDHIDENRTNAYRNNLNLL